VYTCYSDARAIRMTLLYITYNPVSTFYANLHTKMNKAVDRILHPSESLESIGQTFNIPKLTLHDQITGTYAARGVNTRRNLPLVQESVLLDKINAYASRRALLTLHHISIRAERLCGHSFGKNWTSTFLLRNKETATFKYWRI
jgi:hypothetical protein